MIFAKTRKLGDVVDIVGGGTPTKANEGFYEGSIPWATVRDMKQEYLTDTELKITLEAVRNSATNIIKAGNIIIATRVGLGKVCKLQQDTAINQDLKALIPKNNDVDRDYLFWWLKSVGHLILEAGTGATVQGVKIPFIKALDIPLPSISEQKRIVAFLGQTFADIDQALATAETNLKNARELFESYLQRVFSQRAFEWADTTLGQATGGVFTGPFGSLLHKSDYIEGGIPLVNPAHITSVGIDPDMNKTVSEDTAKRLSNYLMSENDIVIGRRGEMGRCAVVSSRESGYLCGTGSFFIKSSKSVNSSYLVRYLRSSSCVRQLEQIAGGAVMPNLSNKDLSNFRISLPPLEKQIDILHLIDKLSSQIETIINIYQRKLNNLDELKKSILQKAFTGELTKSKGIAA